MGPFAGPDLTATIARLRDGQTPISLGQGTASHTVVRADGTYRLCPLVLDEERANAAGEEAIAAGRPWMPEMLFQFKAPGEPLIEERDLETFIEALSDWWPTSMK